MRLTSPVAAAFVAGMSAPLLIIWHSRSGGTEALARAAALAAGSQARMLAADATQPDDLLAARGYLFAAPENLAALSGAMKEMFDRCYYPLLGRVEGRAYASIVVGGSDGTGAQRQLDRIATGWRLRRVAEPLLWINGAQTPEAIAAPKLPPDEMTSKAAALGRALAEGLAMGIF